MREYFDALEAVTALEEQITNGQEARLQDVEAERSAALGRIEAARERIFELYRSRPEIPELSAQAGNMEPVTPDWDVPEGEQWPSAIENQVNFLHQTVRTYRRAEQAAAETKRWRRDRRRDKLTIGAVALISLPSAFIAWMDPVIWTALFFSVVAAALGSLAGAIFQGEVFRHSRPKKIGEHAGVAGAGLGGALTLFLAGFGPLIGISPFPTTASQLLLLLLGGMLLARQVHMLRSSWKRLAEGRPRNP